MIFMILVVVIVYAITTVPAMAGGSKIVFEDDFEKGLDKWDIVNPPKVRLFASGHPEHGRVLALYAGAPVHALIKNSKGWTNIKIEGDVLFPEKEHNYMGLIYNYNIKGPRADYGCIYIKGNGSYIRVNPHRDYLVSRTLYEEYKTPLTGDSAIVTGKWQHFKAEIMGPVCHFYVGDMKTPKVTFAFHEYTSGRVGFEPRVYGSECMLDNITVHSITGFSYKGPMLPAGIRYQPETLITNWDVIGPFRRRHKEIEKDGFVPYKTYYENKTGCQWRSFQADGRGCVLSGRVFEFASQRWFAYFHKKIQSQEKRTAVLGFSSANRLHVWLNGKYTGQIEPVYNAWYDFAENPEHKGSQIKLNLVEGVNHLQILAESVGRKYSGDGFYARLDFPALTP
jgi:hypothetical protein